MRFAAVLAASLFALPSAAEELEAVVDRGAAQIAAALQRTPAVKRIALPPLAESGGASGLAPTVEALLATRLSKLGVDVADRAKLGAVLGEQKLAAMLGGGKGAPDPAAIERAGVQAVLAGSLSDSAGKVLVQLRLTAASGPVLVQFLGTGDHPQKSAARGAPEAIDVAMRRLGDGLAMGFAQMPGSARYRRIAVLTFAETGAEAQKRKIGQVVTAELATDLRRDHAFLLVERARLAEVLGELKLQQMVATPSSAQAGQIGKMADAQALVIGQVSEVGDRFLVNGRIVATETGETLAAESVSVGAAGMVAFASDAVVLRSRSDATFRSLLVPGLGQFYNRQPVKGWLFLGAEVALLGSAVAFHLSGASAYSDYRNVAPASGTSASAEAERLYDVAASRYRTRDVLLVCAGAVWAVNVVDAWVSGVDGQQLLSGGPARVAVVPAAGGGMAVASVRF